MIYFSISQISTLESETAWRVRNMLLSTCPEFVHRSWGVWYWQSCVNFVSALPKIIKCSSFKDSFSLSKTPSETLHPKQNRCLKAINYSIYHTYRCVKLCTEGKKNNSSHYPWKIQYISYRYIPKICFSGTKYFSLNLPIKY